LWRIWILKANIFSNIFNLIHYNFIVLALWSTSLVGMRGVYILVFRAVWNKTVGYSVTSGSGASGNLASIGKLKSDIIRGSPGK
jgi:hypothetical protein